MKPLQIAMLGLIAGLGAFTIDFYLPATNMIAADLDIRTTSASLSISLFIFGMSIGQFIAGPVSDAFGRRPPLLYSLLLFTVSSTLGLVAEHAQTLIFLRLIQAVCAGILAVVVNAIIGDLNNKTDTARLISLTTFIGILTRITAPIASGYLISVGSWRSLALVTALMGGLCLYYAMFIQAETWPAAKRGPLSVRNSLANFMRLLRNRQARIFIGYEIFCAIGLFTFITGSTMIFMDTFGVSAQKFGYLFTIFSIILMLSAYGNNYLVKKIGVEASFYFSIPMTFAFALLLFIAWLIAEVPLWLFCLLFCGYLASILLTRINATAGAIKCIPELAGTAASSIGTAGFAVGGFVGLWLGILYEISDFALVIVLLVSGLANFILLVISQKQSAYPIRQTLNSNRQNV